MDEEAAGDQGQGRDQDHQEYQQEEKPIISVIVVSPASYLYWFLRMRE